MIDPDSEGLLKRIKTEVCEGMSPHDASQCIAPPPVMYPIVGSNSPFEMKREPQISEDLPTLPTRANFVGGRAGQVPPVRMSPSIAEIARRKIRISPTPRPPVKPKKAPVLLPRPTNQVRGFAPPPAKASIAIYPGTATFSQPQLAIVPTFPTPSVPQLGAASRTVAMLPPVNPEPSSTATASSSAAAASSIHAIHPRPVHREANIAATTASAVTNIPHASHSPQASHTSSKRPIKPRPMLPPKPTIVVALSDSNLAIAQPGATAGHEEASLRLSQPPGLSKFAQAGASSSKRAIKPRPTPPQATFLEGSTIVVSLAPAEPKLGMPKPTNSGVIHPLPIGSDESSPMTALDTTSALNIEAQQSESPKKGGQMSTRVIIPRPAMGQQSAPSSSSALKIVINPAEAMAQLPASVEPQASSSASVSLENSRVAARRRGRRAMARLRARLRAKRKDPLCPRCHTAHREIVPTEEILRDLYSGDGQKATPGNKAAVASSDANTSPAFAGEASGEAPMSGGGAQDSEEAPQRCAKDGCRHRATVENMPKSEEKMTPEEEASLCVKFEVKYEGDEEEVTEDQETPWTGCLRPAHLSGLTAGAPSCHECPQADRTSAAGPPPERKQRRGRRRASRCPWSASHRRRRHKSVAQPMNYTCVVCGAVCVGRVALQAHKRGHEAPFNCRFCAKTFTDYAQLQRHTYTHSAPRPFQCKVCRQTFRTLSIRDRHERFHTGQRPFVCRFCSKSFVQSIDVTRHERIHLGIRPFECKTCHKAFTVMGSLQRHERSHVHDVMLSLSEKRKEDRLEKQQ